MSWFKKDVKKVENVGKSVGEALGRRSPKDDSSIRRSADAQLAEQQRFYSALRMREQSALSQDRLQVALGDTPGLTGGDTVDLSSLTIPMDSSPTGPLRTADTFGTTVGPVGAGAVGMVETIPTAPSAAPVPKPVGIPSAVHEARKNLVGRHNRLRGARR